MYNYTIFNSLKDCQVWVMISCSVGTEIFEFKNRATALEFVSYLGVHMRHEDRQELIDLFLEDTQAVIDLGIAV
jgi:hypothetical protein